MIISEPLNLYPYMKFLTDQSRYPNCMRTTLTHSHSENLLGSQKQDATVLITVDITRKKKKKGLGILKLNTLLNPHSPSVNFADNFVEHGLNLAKLIQASRSRRTGRLEVSNSKRKQLWVSIRQNCLGKTSSDPSTHYMESTSEQHPTHILPTHIYKCTHMCPYIHAQYANVCLYTYLEISQKTSVNRLPAEYQLIPS